MNRFFKGTCVLAFALVAACSAKAQDYKGFYIGGYAGGNTSTSDAHTFTEFSPIGYFALSSVPAIGTVGNMNLNPSGFSGGGTAGFNMQWGSIVIGVEGDFGAFNMSETKTGTATYPCCAPTAFTVSQKVETTWLVTGRPRVGFVFGPFLAYATGGAAGARLKYDSVFTDTFATAHENATVHSSQVGWCGGAGLEMKLRNKHWSVKGEYLHADFGQVSTISANLTAFTPPISFPTNAFTHNADLEANMFRGGVNFRF